MEKAIECLNLNTTLKNGGHETNSDAMNHFFGLVISHLNDKGENGKDIRDDESKYNILSNMLCFVGISPNIRQIAEVKMQEIDKGRSLSNLEKQSSVIITEESVAIKR